MEAGASDAREDESKRRIEIMVPTYRYIAITQPSSIRSSMPFPPEVFVACALPKPTNRDPTSSNLNSQNRIPQATSYYVCS